MSLINICRDNHDPFYRYKMPPIQAKIEGRGNGIKTNVLNAVEVARALNRPTAYVIKFFGFELGAQTAMNENQERYLINGVHDANKLQDVLDGFISKFVLCPSCKNPETSLNVTRDGHLKKDCKACGKVTEVDPRLKLVTYILKNPPKSSQKGSKKKQAATASANVVGGGKSISDIASEQKSDGSPGASGAGFTAEAVAGSRLANTEAPPSQKVEVKDDEWAVDMSEEAIEARARELNAMTLKDETEKYEEFGEWILSQDELPSDVAIFKKAQDMDIVNDRKTIEVLAQCLLDEEVLEEIDQHKGMFSKVLTTPKHEKSFLGGIERMIGTEHMDLVPQIPRILMQLYQNDLVSEEVIREWGTHVTKKYVPKDVSKKVRKAAKPFLVWLDEADEDEEENEDDGEDEE
ncbi:hypothetical protein FOA43_002882 [Brettanomyces nanus]|uniref:W2 domain-containing protein n=1 Tax=Eeniella nana TaxID=13502 RepID=A0A875RVH1_EENNA|nr:uncharacterized protein FOA43_002882 [Brettanomyces nanus]QPG75527.1 hypothetical protein FOA43_002882 [Brettanomyces nanus]